MQKFPPHLIAEGIRRLGRGSDTMLAHINPREAALLKQRGGSGTINPYTGLREFDDGGGDGGGGGGADGSASNDQSSNDQSATSAAAAQDAQRYDAVNVASQAQNNAMAQASVNADQNAMAQQAMAAQTGQADGQGVTPIGVFSPSMMGFNVATLGTPSLVAAALPGTSAYSTTDATTMGMNQGAVNPDTGYSMADYTQQMLNTPYQGTLLNAAMYPGTAFGFSYPGLIGKIDTKEGAASFLANLGYESAGFNPQATNGTALGLAQWTRFGLNDPAATSAPRQDQMLAALGMPASQISTLSEQQKAATLAGTGEQQLGFGLNEALTNPQYAATAAAMANSTNSYDATQTIRQNYEAPGSGDTSLASRQVIANEALAGLPIGTPGLINSPLTSIPGMVSSDAATAPVNLGQNSSSGTMNALMGGVKLADSQSNASLSNPSAQIVDGSNPGSIISDASPSPEQSTTVAAASGTTPAPASSQSLGDVVGVALGAGTVAQQVDKVLNQPNNVAVDSNGNPVLREDGSAYPNTTSGMTQQEYADQFASPTPGVPGSGDISQVQARVIDINGQPQVDYFSKDLGTMFSEMVGGITSLPSSIYSSLTGGIPSTSSDNPMTNPNSRTSTNQTRDNNGNVSYTQNPNNAGILSLSNVANLDFSKFNNMTNADLANLKSFNKAGNVDAIKALFAKLSGKTTNTSSTTPAATTPNPTYVQNTYTGNPLVSSSSIPYSNLPSISSYANPTPTPFTFSSPSTTAQQVPPEVAASSRARAIQLAGNSGLGVPYQKPDGTWDIIQL